MIRPTIGTREAVVEVRAQLLTTSALGAVAVIALFGAVERALESLAGRPDWPVGVVRVVTIGGIDRGVVARVDDSYVLLMPHGGSRVVQRIMSRLLDEGIEIVVGASTAAETRGRVEAAMLEVVARAASPLAIPLLLAQPERWRNAGGVTEDDRARSERLNSLIDPPVVALAGRPNVGKSTLTNRLVGRRAAIATDRPGTTRDHVFTTVNLRGLVVRWLDTPGLRQTADHIESRAIEVAERALHSADFIIALTDHEHDLPVLPRSPDVVVANKGDVGRRTDVDCSISALTGDGIERFVSLVRDRIVPAADLENEGPWLFHSGLEAGPGRIGQ